MDELARRLLDGIGDALVVVDAGLTVVGWNAALERATGVGRADALGRSIDADLPVLRVPEVRARLRRAAAGGAPDPLELQHVAPGDGDPRWLELRCTPWHDDAGRVLAALGVLADVTDRRRRERFVRAVEAIGQSLASSLDLDEVLDAAGAKALAAMGAEAALVVAWDGAAPEFRVLRAAGRLSREYAAAGVIQAGGGPIARAVRERRIVTTRNILTDPEVSLPPERRAQVEREGYKAAAAAPLVAEGRAHGALVVHYWEERAFDAEELAAFRLLAEQASLAIHNARLFGEAERRRDGAEVLARLARELTGSLDEPRIAELLAAGIVELVASRGAAVYRFASEDGSLRAVAAAGFDAPAVEGTVLGPGEGVAGRAVAERRTVAVGDVLTEVPLPAEVRARLAASGRRAVVGVPLLTRDRVIGAVAVGLEAGRALGAEEVRTLEALADQAALAFENARLYAAARDSLVRLRDAQAQLVQAAKMSALGQLVSGVAHELNNPLSVIIGYGQLLLSRQVPAPLERPVELMVSQADRMAKIVRNLLFFSRQRAPERLPVSLNEIIEQTLSLRLNHLQLSGIEVERRFAAKLPPISGDPHQLEQVFLNLLLNAEQAIREGGSGHRIVLRTRVAEAGRAVEAQVVDDGPGIPADTLPHIFEPFFTTKTLGSGTGLGLSVSYGIVQEHGGRLTVESRPGETTFTLALPVIKSPEPALVPPSADPLAPVRGEGRVALVVDDEPSVVDLVSTLLHQTGWKVDVANGGRLGLERVRGRRYDLVVSDVRMPEGGGEDFYRTAVQSDPTLHRRFVFITGDTANRSAWGFLEGAGVPVIEKPFQAALFFDVIRRVTTGAGA